jgi:alkylhydroperoxidase family enzyme
VDEDGSLTGPFNARLLNPAIGRAMGGLATSVRYATGLTDRIRELVILTVASTLESEYEWYAHQEPAVNAGVSEAEMMALASREDILNLELAETVAISAARELLVDFDLSDSTYEKSRSVLGEKGLFELVALVGSYMQTALQLRVFRVALPTTHEVRG